MMQAFIDAASRSQVVSGARLVKSNYLPNRLMADVNNPLVKDATQAVYKHVKRIQLISTDHFSTYLASSSILHVLDGWSYLSSAIERLLNGDSAIATHLAYYAELRATMSFLATEGIGVFDKSHLCINKTNQIVIYPLDEGTHEFAWSCIDAWKDSTIKPLSNDLLKVFSSYGFNFDEWANKFPFNTQAVRNQVAKSWLRSWNSDLRIFRNDRDTRNHASYRPQRFTDTNVQNLNSNINKLNTFWQMFEPDGGDKFSVLDKYLLRIYLQRLYDHLSTAIRKQNPLEDVVKSTIENLGLSVPKSLIDFLCDKQPIPQSLFAESRKSALDSSTGSYNPLSVIARATLMLRLSTGSASALFSKIGASKNEFDFIWDRYGLENGFWGNGALPSDFYDLWVTVKDQIDDMIDWNNSQQSNLKLSTILNDAAIPIPFNFFKQFNRAALWGFKL